MSAKKVSGKLSSLASIVINHCENKLMVEIVSELLMRIFALKLEQLATHQQNDYRKMKKKVCENSDTCLRF